MREHFAGRFRGGDRIFDKHPHGTCGVRDHDELTPCPGDCLWDFVV